jgi:uncharacterized protein YegP (UPF0339 family)
MVTDVAYPIESIGQLYRDRADCENGFDELKKDRQQDSCKNLPHRHFL